MSRGPLDELFGALADPTRRFILQRLIHQGPATATHLAGECPTSRDAPLTRQAIVKHLQILVDAGLARPVRVGREVRYTATPAPLATVVSWLTETGPRWDRRMEKFRGRLDTIDDQGTSTA
ncbi:MAG: metalloregulator ArsR/SmtB family transcription factor [Ilumatobacteraceae bacterium]